MRKPDVIVAVGSLELEVPIRVIGTFQAGYPDTWDEPGCPAHIEVTRFERLDGLPMNAAVEAACEHWWDKGGEEEMIALERDRDDDRPSWRRRRRNGSLGGLI